MEEFGKYTVGALQEILRQKGLPINYRKKQDLIDRVLGITDTEGDSNTGDVDSENSISEDSILGDNVKEGSCRSGLNGIALAEVKNVNSMTEEKNVCYNSFVFKDVEESLEKFNGETGKDVKTWLKDFEDIAEVCGWNEVQKYLYTRRLLRGAAKLSIEAKAGIHSWELLKNFLETEFKDIPTSLSVHRLLENRKKGSNESFLEYMYDMKRIANRGSIDEESLVAYIIAGITDDVQNKAILYDARTLDQLKIKVKAYETLKSHQKPTCSGKRGHSTVALTEKGRGNVSKRCYNCGSKFHLTASCPNRSKGARCFSCGAYGHMSSNCNQSRTVKASTSQPREEIGRSSVSIISVPDLSVPVILGRGQYRGLVDTGSGVTLIRRSVLDDSKISLVDSGPSTILSGFGQSLKHTLGSVLTCLKINDDSYTVRCHIVPDSWITNDILIGLDIIKSACLRIEDGKLFLNKTKETLLDERPDFLDKIDVVQLVEELKYDSLDEINDATLREEIHNLIAEYSPQKPSESCVKMNIQLEDGAVPVYIKPRRLAPKEKEIVSKQIEEWMDEGIIRPSCSDFASPVVLARKKDGSYRLCVDYRKLNRSIVRDRYPLPNMEDILEDLHSAFVFTTLDLRNGFFHVDVDESSKKFTAFLTSDGQFEFNKVPFGLCNSPAVFQRFINVVFQPLIRDRTLLLYMDDIIIPALSEIENVQKLKKVLDLAQKHGLLIKWSKCKFLRRSVGFLGHIVEQGSIRPSKDKTAAVENFPEPHNIKDVQSFLGLTGFFRRFVREYSIVAKPLTDLIKKDACFHFGPKQREAFALLKERLSSAPVLKLFNPKLETELHTDASKVGFGGTLLQKHLDTGKFYPVFYLSFKSTEAEQKYTSYELEVLAIVKSLRRLRQYLLGIKFTIYTDCKAFELTMRRTELNSRVARWALFMEEFDCRVIHRPGSMLRHVDALSRYPSVCTIEVETLLRVKQAQSRDEFCQLVQKCLEYGQYKDFLLRNDVLYKFAEGNYLLVLPKSLQRGIITNIHEQGHISARKVEMAMCQEYYVPSLSKKVQAVIENCVACILAARKMGKPEGILNPIEKFDQPLHTYHVDHLGPLTSTAKNYKYLFVVIDAFTKFSWIYPVKSTTSDEVIRRLEMQSEIFGNPHRIVADRGTAFTSTTFKSYCEERNISLVFITTGVPRGNGQVERLNQVIINVLSKMSVEEPSKWFKHVPQLQKVLNSTCSRATGKTPFQLMFGVKMSRPERLELSRVVEEEIIIDFENERNIARQEAKEQINKIQEENRRYSRRKRKPARVYREGDLVAIRRIQFTTGGKLLPRFLGPYQVIASKGHDRYEVRKVGNHEGPNSSSSAADLMKPWTDLAEGYSSGTDEIQDGRMWESDPDE